MPFEIKKPGFYRTVPHEGREKVEVLAIRENIAYGIDYLNMPCSWYLDGKVEYGCLPITAEWKEPRIVDLWVNIFSGNASIWSKRENADVHACDRIACRHIRYDESLGKIIDITEESDD